MGDDVIKCADSCIVLNFLLFITDKESFGPYLGGGVPVFYSSVFINTFFSITVKKFCLIFLRAHLGKFSRKNYPQQTINEQGTQCSIITTTNLPPLYLLHVRPNNQKR